MGSRKARAAIAAVFAIALSGATLHAAGCPEEPDWSYGTGPTGQQNWASLFPILCGRGSQQSPFGIVTAGVTRAKLPKLTFHYKVADVVVLDYDDQVEFNHGAGNFITIGKTVYDLINIHEHTPSEYTVNGQQFAMEIHLVHKNAATGQLAVVGVLVNAGAADPGIIQGPSPSQPTAVDLKLTELIPKKKNYVRFNGSLTTPGHTITLPRCAESVLWTTMLTPITLSSGQIAEFEDAARACWGTSITNRPLSPANNRFLLMVPPKVDP